MSKMTQLLRSSSLKVTMVSFVKIFFKNNSRTITPISWHGRIYRLHLCRGVRPPPTNVLDFDTKQSDDKAPVMLQL